MVYIYSINLVAVNELLIYGEMVANCTAEEQ